MSRFLSKQGPAGVAAAADGGGGGGKGGTNKEALERIAKYIPVEILGPYLGIQSFLVEDADGTVAKVVLAVCCLAALLFIPTYIKKYAEPGDATKTHIQMGLIAFPIWVYAGAVTPAAFGFYNGYVAGAALFLFTLWSGRTAPTK